ncbi:MAG: Holliday junction resolvase RuvX [candidate division WOR-3 bacterium]|nr:Holliday junction resolvase RuvX [candidate division WOR-3 bacterium]
MGRILAIDYGKRNIGLAISDETKTIAYGIDGIHYKNEETAIEKLQIIIKEKNIEKIILGYPLAMSGKDTQMSQLVLEFKKVLEQKFNLPIILFDERFTTEISKRIIQERGKKSFSSKRLIDKLSAVVILQDYLTSIKK